MVSQLNDAEVDEALDWLATHCAVLDNIRWRRGEWSIRLFVDKPARDEPARHFQARRFTDALDEALQFVIEERHRIGLRGGEEP